MIQRCFLPQNTFSAQVAGLIIPHVDDGKKHPPVIASTWTQPSLRPRPNRRLSPYLLVSLRVCLPPSVYLLFGSPRISEPPRTGTFLIFLPVCLNVGFHNEAHAGATIHLTPLLRSFCPSKRLLWFFLPALLTPDHRASSLGRMRSSSSRQIAKRITAERLMCSCETRRSRVASVSGSSRTSTRVTFIRTLYGKRRTMREN